MLLEVDQLVVALGGRTVLHGVTCALDAPVVGLLGPNGAGKSTLVRTLLGFHRPTSGTCRVLGHDVTRDSRAIRSLVGYAPENESFIPGMTAVRFVRYMAELHGLPPEDAMERAHEALSWAGLGEARYRKLETFSLGMKQRVKLAQAVVHGPKLVLLDEPTNGLDPPGRLHVLRLIGDLKRERGLHVIVSSHLLRDVEEVADHVLILKEGLVARSCDLDAQRRSNLRFLELELAGGDARAFLADLAHQGCEHVPARHGRVRVVLPPEVPIAAVFAHARTHDVALRRLTQRRDTLEDLFLEAMGEWPAAASGALSVGA